MKGLSHGNSTRPLATHLLLNFDLCVSQIIAQWNITIINKIMMTFCGTYLISNIWIIVTFKEMWHATLNRSWESNTVKVLITYLLCPIYFKETMHTTLHRQWKGNCGLTMVTFLLVVMHLFLRNIYCGDCHTFFSHCEWRNVEITKMLVYYTESSLLGYITGIAAATRRWHAEY